MKFTEEQCIAFYLAIGRPDEKLSLVDAAEWIGANIPPEQVYSDYVLFVKEQLFKARNQRDKLYSSCLHATGAYKLIEDLGLHKDLPGYDYCLKALLEAVDEAKSSIDLSITQHIDVMNSIKNDPPR